MRMVAKTMQGLEPVLSKELLRLGARDITEHRRAVSFVGDKGFLYKANFCLRTALRVLVPIGEFEVRSEQELYDGIRRIDWEEWMNVDDTLAVDATLGTKRFTNSLFIGQKTKDAVVDQFRDKYNKRPSVDTEMPTLRINIHIADVFGDERASTRVSVAVDSSGESLHKRGYRSGTNLAPLNEVLAAGMIQLSGWERHKRLVDGMCGSGTLLIEAALQANNIPPGIFRESFGFMRWADFETDLWEKIRESMINRISEEKQELIGIDISYNVLRKARENIKRAGVDDVIKTLSTNFTAYDPPQGPGMVILNPPYGERMNKDDVQELYKSIGDTLKKKYAGYEAWIISSNEDAFKAVGLRHSRNITLFNGPLECRFRKFDLYAGTKKIHKLAPKSEPDNDAG